MSHRHLATLIVMGAGILVAASPVAGQILPTTLVGTVTGVEGAPIVERDLDRLEAEMGLPLLAGDRIRTGDGRLAVSLVGAGRVYVDTATVVVLRSADVVTLERGRIEGRGCRPARSCRRTRAPGQLRAERPLPDRRRRGRDEHRRRASWTRRGPERARRDTRRCWISHRDGGRPGADPGDVVQHRVARTRAVRPLGREPCLRGCRPLRHTLHPSFASLPGPSSARRRTRQASGPGRRARAWRDRATLGADLAVRGRRRCRHRLL